MRTLRHALLASSVLVPPAVAQEAPPKPAKELQKFAKLLGNWKGTGQAIHAPGTPATGWTATASFSKILNGHFIREKVTVDVTADQPMQFQLMNIFGWDRENSRYIAYGLASEGRGTESNLHWIGDKMVITIASLDPEGQPLIQRETVHFPDNDTYSFKMERAVGTGEFFKYVWGTLKRTTKTPDTHIEPASVAVGKVRLPLPKAMAPLSGTIGKWKIAGRFTPMPGAPEMQFTGTETVRRLFGGQILEFDVKADPDANGAAYAGTSFLTWSEHKGCYLTFYVDNMGECGVGECHVQGSKIVSLGKAKKMGKPIVQRYIVHLDADGGYTKAHGDRISSDSPVETKVFEATYERMK